MPALHCSQATADLARMRCFSSNWGLASIGHRFERRKGNPFCLFSAGSRRKQWVLVSILKGQVKSAEIRMRHAFHASETRDIESSAERCWKSWKGVSGGECREDNAAELRTRPRTDEFHWDACMVWWYLMFALLCRDLLQGVLTSIVLMILRVM